MRNKFIERENRTPYIICGRCFTKIVSHNDGYMSAYRLNMKGRVLLTGHDYIHARCVHSQNIVGVSLERFAQKDGMAFFDSMNSRNEFAELADGGVWRMREALDVCYHGAKENTGVPPYGGVYIIQCKRFYKVGVARDIQDRLSTMQTCNPYKLTLIHVIPCKVPYQTENIIHKFYASKRVRNEWFALNADDLITLMRM